MCEDKLYIYIYTFEQFVYKTNQNKMTASFTINYLHYKKVDKKNVYPPLEVNINVNVIAILFIMVLHKNILNILGSLPFP